MEVLSSRVIVHPADLDAARRFYEGVLGLAIHREWGVGVSYFLGGGHLELSQRQPGEGPAGPTTLWLQLRTLEGVEDELRAAGATVVRSTATMPWGLVELWIADVDGNVLHLVEVPEDHPLRTRGRRPV